MMPDAPMLRLGTLYGTDEPFCVPVDAAIQRYVVLAKSDAGKTNTTAVFVEEVMRAARVPAIVLDALGNMHGLRSSFDGLSAGLAMALFGGHQEGALPLPLHRATYLADLLAEGVPAILDLSHFGIEEYLEFVNAFLPRLLQRAQVNLFVAVEEADRAARNTGKTTPVTQWARAARNGGIGWLFSTHKPQVLHREIIDTANVFIPMRITGELASDAMGGEIGSRIGKKTAAALLNDLGHFKRGDAWFIPEGNWIIDGPEGVPTKIRFRLRDTFHVRPPKVGEQKREPKVLAAVDLVRLRRALQDDVAEAKAASAAAPATAPDDNLARDLQDQRERADHAENQLSALAEEANAASARVVTLRAALETIAARVEEIRETIATALVTDAAGEVEFAATYVPPRGEKQPVARARVSAAREPFRAHDLERSTPKPDSRSAPVLRDLGAASIAVLMAVASDRNGRMGRRRVAALAGYSSRKSTLRNALSALRTRGLIETAGEDVVLTEAGRKAAGPARAPTTTAQTIELWRGKVAEAGPRALLDVLIGAYPHFIPRPTLAKRAGIDPAKSTFRNALSRLRMHGLLHEQGDDVCASAELFPTGPIKGAT